MKDINEIWMIEWQDAHSQPGWLTTKETEDFIKEEKCICVSIGFMLSETNDEIVLASRKLRWKEDGEKGKWDKWGDFQKIPKAWIRKKLLFTMEDKND